MTHDLEERLRTDEGAEARAEAAAGRVADRAAEEGLVDVAYARVDSPLGPLLAAATDRGLVRLAYLLDGEDEVLTDLARLVSPRVLEHPARLDRARRELDEYFAGSRRDFDLDLDLSTVRGFGARVLEATAAIPFGGSATYTTVAERAGSPRAVRAAGSALGRNPIPVIVPCHRVLRSGGGLGGYTGGLVRKRFLLALEGHPAD